MLHRMIFLRLATTVTTQSVAYLCLPVLRTVMMILTRIIISYNVNNNQVDNKQVEFIGISC